MPKEKKKSESSNLWKILFFILKIPYYVVKGIYNLISWMYKSGKAQKTSSQRYEEFKTIKLIKGDPKKWVQEVYSSDSKIGIILGSRGSGKTAFGLKLLENAHVTSKKRCYALGFQKEEMPSWIHSISSISEIENNSFVLVDEGGILFNSRKSMSSANKVLSDLILISRHKNLSILFISQNSSNLEVNVLRQADFLAMKKSSLLQKEFERKVVQKFYQDVEKDFEKLKDVKGLTYIYSSSFRGFISNPLPSFWRESISKSFK